MLEYGELVMKVVVGAEDHYYAAGVNAIRDFFVLGTLAKVCPNYLFAPSYTG